MMGNHVLITDYLWFQEGPGVRNTQYTSSGVKLLNVANFVDGNIDLSTSSRYISDEEAYGKYKHFLVDEGDFLIASSGIQVDYFEKKMGFIRPDQLPLCMNTSTIRFKNLKPNDLDMRYFMYYLKSNAFKNQLAKHIVGSAQLNFGPSHLKKMTFQVVNIDKQRYIVENLDKLYTLIALRKEQLAKLDQLVKSRFIELFGSPIANEYGWPIATLGELCLKITDGEHQNPQFVDNGIPMVMANNVQDKGVVFDGCRYISAENYEKFSRKCCPEFGDVLLVSRGATIGRCCINSESIPFSLMGSVILIKNNKKRISSAYLVNWLKNEEIKPMIYTTSSASAQQAIYMKDLVVRKVAVPPMELQEQYAAFVEQTDKSKLAIQQSLDKLELLKKSLMQEYFGQRKK